MTLSKPTWAVVATVDEPPAVVQAFVAWHLAQGASHIYIYCDRPDDPVMPLLAPLSKVTATGCDAAHWALLGRNRPRRHEVRQVRNARHAYAATKADWLVHIDADEFLWAARPVADILSQLPDEIDGFVAPVAERMHTLEDAGESVFEGAFRRPFHGTGSEGRAAFGRGYHLTFKGLTCHAQGKTFARTGRAISLSIHRARSDVKGYDVCHERASHDDLALLHFDGLTPLHWAFKLARMAYVAEKKGGMPPPQHRQRQADALRADVGQAADLYHRLKSVDADQEVVMRRHGIWSDQRCDINAALTVYFPDCVAQLRPEAIDDWLRFEKGYLLAHMNL
jgi:hypothetical protein